VLFKELEQKKKKQSKKVEKKKRRCWFCIALPLLLH